MPVNYFEFYAIPVSLFPNKATLRAKYYSYARKFHPDHNSDAEAEIMAALNNEAFQCLSSIEGRLEHILKISGVNLGDQVGVSNDFLMDVMEIQEAIMEIDNMDAKKIEIMRAELQGLLDGLDKQLKYAEEELEQNSENWINLLKENWKRRKYLKRMEDNLQGKLD